MTEMTAEITEMSEDDETLYTVDDTLDKTLGGGVDNCGEEKMADNDIHRSNADLRREIASLPADTSGASFIFVLGRAVTQ